jgi:hypothetical protein
MSLVLEIGADENRWKEGHEVFGSLGARTLRHERIDRVSICSSALLLAEAVCKVIFNESGEAGPFDPDSGDWIAKNAAFLASKAVDNELTNRLWQALANRGPMPPNSRRALGMSGHARFGVWAPGTGPISCPPEYWGVGYDLHITKAVDWVEAEKFSH